MPNLQNLIYLEVNGIISDEKLKSDFKSCLPFCGEPTEENKYFLLYVHGYNKALELSKQRIEERELRITELEREFFRKNYDLHHD